MTTQRESHPSHLAVATFGAEARLRVDADRDVYVRNTRVTRAGGWLRIGATDAKIPRVLQWIAVHLRVDVDHGRTTNVSIDRVRFGDVEWDDIECFLREFDGVWKPHLVEQTRRVLFRAATTGLATERDGAE